MKMDPQADSGTESTWNQLLVLLAIDYVCVNVDDHIAGHAEVDL